MTGFLEDLVIRPAAAADAGAVAAIYAEAVAHGTASFEIEPPGEAEIERRMAALRQGGYPYLVAVAGGRIVGYAYAGPHHRRHGYRNTVEDSVYIAADARRKGLGRSLLSAVIAECEALGFRQMVAVIGDAANVASVRLHQAAGFRLVGTLSEVGYKHGRWLDVVLMQRPLGEGSGAPPSR